MLPPPKQTKKAPSLLTGLVLGYLALPNLLFAAGWLRPLPALLVMGAILFLVVRLMVTGTMPILPHFNRKRIWALWGLLAILTGCWVLSTGMTGFVAQPIDYIVRNAIFATLVRCDWPLHLPDGSDFIYYLVSWLPPALAARFHPEGAFPVYCLAGWCFLGLFLMLLLMERKLGKRVLLFAVLLILCGNAVAWIDNGYRALFREQLILYAPFAYFYSNGSIVQLAMTFHHVIPVWLVLALYFSGTLSWKNTLCASSLVLLASPLGSIGLTLLLIFLWAWNYEKEGERIERLRSLLKEPALYAGTALAVVAFLYFSSNGEGGNFCWVWERLSLNSAWLALNCALWALLATGLTVALIFWIARVTGNGSNPLVWFVIGMLMLLPVFFVGVNYNELLFKASCIPYWIMALLLTQWFCRADNKRRCLIALFILLTSGEAANTLNLCYRTRSMPEEQKWRAEWQWHLYHPEHFWYARFNGRIRAPHFFYSEAGESAQTLLFWCRRNNRSDREVLPPPTPWTGAEAPAGAPNPFSGSAESARSAQ